MEIYLLPSRYMHPVYRVTVLEFNIPVKVWVLLPYEIITFVKSNMMSMSVPFSADLVNIKMSREDFKEFASRAQSYFDESFEHIGRS